MHAPYTPLKKTSTPYACASYRNVYDHHDSRTIAAQDDNGTFTHLNGASNNTSIERYENNCDLAHKALQHYTISISTVPESDAAKSSL